MTEMPDTGTVPDNGTIINDGGRMREPGFRIHFTKMTLSRES
jgi:hypothetical protein